MKTRDLVNLLNRAAAGLEHLEGLTERERDELVEDLVVAAREVDGDGDSEREREHITLNERELATVLAALRVYQARDWRMAAEVDKTILEGMIALDDNEIDELCMRLNT